MQEYLKSAETRPEEESGANGSGHLKDNDNCRAHPRFGCDYWNPYRRCSGVEALRYPNERARCSNKATGGADQHIEGRSRKPAGGINQSIRKGAPSLQGPDRRTGKANRRHEKQIPTSQAAEAALRQKLAEAEERLSQAQRTTDDFQVAQLIISTISSMTTQAALSTVIRLCQSVRGEIADRVAQGIFQKSCAELVPTNKRPGASRASLRRSGRRALARTVPRSCFADAGPNASSSNVQLAHRRPPSRERTACRHLFRRAKQGGRVPMRSRAYPHRRRPRRPVPIGCTRLKHDGYRMLAVRDGARACLVSGAASIGASVSRRLSVPRRRRGSRWRQYP